MTYYEEIERQLENINASSDIRVTIDDIDTKSITFSVYDSEVTDESLSQIYEIIHFIDLTKDLNTMTDIKYYPAKNIGMECFTLRFEFDIGDDVPTEYDYLQQQERDKDDKEYQDYQSYKERNLE